MRLTFVDKAWLVSGLTAIACSIDADPEGAGKACSSDGRCSPGYHCGAERRCIAGPAGQDDAGVEGGRGGTGAAGVSGSGPSRDGQAGTSADAVSDVPFSEAGGQGGIPADAAPVDGPPVTDAGCANPNRYYADGDGDGFGQNDSTLWACGSPSGSWAIRGGDCNDADDRVFPGQTAFFGVGYAHAGGDSFDYDCSSAEQSDPTQPGPAPNCADLDVLSCRGSGFDSNDRSGPLADPICGSTKLVECVPALLACSARTSTTDPKRCH